MKLVPLMSEPIFRVISHSFITITPKILLWKVSIFGCFLFQAANWLVNGTLNVQIISLNLSAAIWLLCNIIGQDLNSKPSSAWMGWVILGSSLPKDTLLNIQWCSNNMWGLWDNTEKWHGALQKYLGKIFLFVLMIKSI